MQSIKPHLIQLLEKLPLHDRQSLLDTLLKYPEMTPMVVGSFKLKSAKADPDKVKAYEAACLQQVEKLYGTKASAATH
ncbi:MAG: hypothetical protein HY565_02595 [Candidatus Kerfeldbacteria bacterium]|nr:hypothetical protein [Candidatus Kerfeldbacteria bacterium]